MFISSFQFRLDDSTAGTISGLRLNFAFEFVLTSSRRNGQTAAWQTESLHAVSGKLITAKSQAVHLYVLHSHLQHSTRRNCAATLCLEMRASTWPKGVQTRMLYHSTPFSPNGLFPRSEGNNGTNEIDFGRRWCRSGHMKLRIALLADRQPLWRDNEWSLQNHRASS